MEAVPCELQGDHHMAASGRIQPREQWGRITQGTDQWTDNGFLCLKIFLLMSTVINLQ